MDPLKDRETKESGCSWQMSSLTFGCALHNLMTHYVHTDTVRDRVARQASLYDRENGAVLLSWHTSTLLDGDGICQTLWIICQYDPIIIFNGCEVLIENSVTRVTVRHHSAVRHHVACRVMPNSYSSDGFFKLHPRTIMDSFSCILSLRQLHLHLNMCCFINFTLKWLHFSIKKSSAWLLSYKLTSKLLAKTNVKMTSRRLKWR